MPPPKPPVLSRLRGWAATITWSHVVTLGIVLVLFVVALALSIEAARVAAGGS
ncbi:MAG: hypothetical protein JWO46_773 [Nocardioidaceae bacterium]|nr:hypothetical protein [Nocardioidaceae bacterium]